MSHILKSNNTATLFFDKLSIPYKELGITVVIAPISDWHLNGRTSDSGFKGRDGLNLILFDDNTADLNNNMIGSLDESVLKSVLASPPTENYRVPQPIYNKRLVPGKTLSSNALQNAIHQKIIYLKPDCAVTSLFFSISSTNERLIIVGEKIKSVNPNKNPPECYSPRVEIINLDNKIIKEILYSK